MATEKFANSAMSSLVSGISDLDLSLTVVSAASFPATPQFRLLIEAEILLVTGVAGATFTVSRGQEGTVAAPHALGASVRGILTAGAVEQLKADAGAGFIYMPLVAGKMSAGTVYEVLGTLPARDWQAIMSGTLAFTFQALLNIPASSTAQIRLYDATNHTTLWESTVLAGPQSSYAINQVVTPAAGSTVLEVWLSTPTNTGGDASCAVAGLLVTSS